MATPEFERPYAESTSEFEQVLEGIVEKTLAGDTLDRQTATLFERFQSVARSLPADEPLSTDTVRELVWVVVDGFLSEHPAARSSPRIQNAVDRIVESLLSTPYTAQRLERFWRQLQKSVR